MHDPSAKTTVHSTLPCVGWREWVALPELGIRQIKAKVDTGARTSSLHASSLDAFRRRGKDWVRFQVFPRQRTKRGAIDVEAPVLEYRSVRSSNGKASDRPVIVTPIELLGVTYDVEVTLASRDEMGFRMLLGRQALSKRFVVDPGTSFLGGQPAPKAPNRRHRP